MGVEGCRIEEFRRKTRLKRISGSRKASRLKGISAVLITLEPRRREMSTSFGKIFQKKFDLGPATIGPCVSRRTGIARLLAEPRRAAGGRPTAQAARRRARVERSPSCLRHISVTTYNEMTCRQKIAFREKAYFARRLAAEPPNGRVERIFAVWAAADEALD